METLLLILLLATTQPTQPVYRCALTASPVTIDGKLDDAAWSEAEWTTDFVDIRGGNLPAPPLRTRAKLLWNDRTLYIAAELEETDIRAEFKQRDDPLYRENAFEIFIDPDEDGKDYVEIEINAINTIFDLKMNRPYRAGGRADQGFTVAGMQTAVSVDGTLNDPSDRDRAWTVEVAIPLESVAKARAGSKWRVNFARAEHLPDGGKAQFFTWSPHGKVDMHIPDRWGVVEFMPFEAKH